jgi:hypothetical protein
LASHPKIRRLCNIRNTEIKEYEKAFEDSYSYNMYFPDLPILDSQNKVPPHLVELKL